MNFSQPQRAAIGAVESVTGVRNGGPISQAATIARIDAIGAGDDYLPLDQRVLEASARLGVALKSERSHVVADIQQHPGKLGEPEYLFAVQQKISDYSLQVSLASALTRKGVAAIETVLRA